MSTPTAPPNLPEAEEFRLLLAQLVGKPVLLKAPPGLPKPNLAPQVQAMYCTSDGVARAMCSVDLLLAANLGAALALMPPGVAADAARAGKMTDLLADCAHEVFNVWARLFNRPSGVHLTLKTIAFPPETIPADVRAILFKSPLRREYDFEVTGYARGKIIIRVI